MNGTIETTNTIDDYHLITQGSGIYLQHHVPMMMNEPYHVHPSLEINFLQGCDMVYSFGGKLVHVPQDRFCLFWAAQPHRVYDVVGKGKITNAYVALEDFWSWPLPAGFVNTILAGGVIAAKETLADDAILAARLASEVAVVSEQLSRLHLLEIQARMTRLALHGWDLIKPPRIHTESIRSAGNAMRHFEKVLRFIAKNYADPITLQDVAEAANVSPNYANALSKKILGTTIKVHINNVRVFHARMLLAETDDKIISIAFDCGFRSNSSFYEAFHRVVGTSPAQFRASHRR